MKKVNVQTWVEITKPLKEAAKNAGMKESNVDDIIHKIRKNEMSDMRKR